MPDEYIRRAEALEITTRTCGDYAAAFAEIRKLPAADVAEVVRCKDCRYYRNHPNGLCYLHTESKENERGYSGEAVCVEPDDFCSYGERREGGNDNETTQIIDGCCTACGALMDCCEAAEYKYCPYCAKRIV